MIKRFLTAFLLVAMTAISGDAQLLQLMGVGGGGGTSGAAPGDIVSGASEWYGLRAYSGAYAASLGKAINVTRDSDSTNMDINVLANGALNIAAANTFAGTDATCTGTIASTTLSCTAASGTPHAGSTLTGAGLTQPSFIISCGTFTGGAGTCTLNATQTVSVGETITMQWRLRSSLWYDQSGNARNAGNGVSIATSPQLLPSCINGLPCLDFLNGCCNLVLGALALSQPYTLSGVYIRQGNFSNFNVLMQNVNTIVVAFGPGPTANLFEMYAGAALSVSATDNAWHAAQGVFNDPSGSFVNIDGTDTSMNGIGTNVWQNQFNQQYIGHNTGTGQELYGHATEIGIWPSAFSAANRTAMCHSQFLYWGTSTSC